MRALIVENDVVLNVVEVADPDPESGAGPGPRGGAGMDWQPPRGVLEPVPEGVPVGPGWRRVGGEWTKPEPDPKAVARREERERRKQARASATEKLRGLGLSDEEIDALRR